jgi:1,2-phenylacetyl-CoA epoxidase catalytic subunit
LRTMNIFGRPGSSRNALYRKYRLKIRDNDEVRQAFHDEVLALTAQWGLTLPHWTPDY